MRVVLVNKFYYPRGGDCVAVMATERLLKARGHEVAIFSMQYPANISSSWETYFPAEVIFSGTTVAGSIRAAERIFRAGDVATRFTRLLNDFNPDVVHLHNIHSYLSPVVAQVARRKGVRVVWTMHDYKLICPAYSCLRGGKPCEACFSRKSGVFKHACMKGSRAAGLLAWMEALYWNRKKLERLTDGFISPSAFLKGKMVSAGFRAEQIEVLPNFMHRHTPPPAGKGDYYCYTGRLSAEKGVSTLLEAAKRLPCPLKVIGGGPLFHSLRRQYPQEHIEFTGQLPAEQLLPIVQRARFLVMPSVWYENNPFSMIEALCLGTPVLGANIGGIPELIEDGLNGMLFEPGNPEDLTEHILKMQQTAFPYQTIARQALEKFSAEKHYEHLLAIYQNKLPESDLIHH
ncbi:MAG: glycosyltransferase [Tannerella sp.]|nr:glycosyltransferase [Tannerella sp.]